MTREGHIPSLLFFDLDGTLALSKQPIESEMAALLTKLLAVTRVAIISGGALSQFLKQVVALLPVDANLAHLYLLPTSGAALYEFDYATSLTASWKKIYEERLSEKEKDTIETAMLLAAKETSIIDFNEESFGERIEYRGGQVSLSALGQHAPLELKKKWDPQHAKRHLLQTVLASRLREFSVNIGGATTIDVTKRGIDKAYGIHQLCERLRIKESHTLYVGDELESGGNDEAVYKTEAQAKAIKDPTETMHLIKSLLANVH